MRAVPVQVVLCITLMAGASGFSPLCQEEQSAQGDIEESLAEARYLLEEALALHSQADKNGAQSTIQLVEEVLGTIEGADDREELSESRWNLGNLALKVGDYHLARRAFERVLEYREEYLDPDDERIMRARGNLAVACHYVGDLTAALELDRENLEFVTRILPADHLDLQRTRKNLAASLLQAGEIEEARALLEASIAVLEETVPANHIELLKARLNLGVAFARQGRHAQAAGMFARLLEVQESSLPPNHPDIQQTRLNLAAMLRSSGDYSASYALHGKVLDVYAQQGVEDDPGLIMARMNFAVLCMQMGDLDGSEALLRRVMAADEGVLPHGHPTRLLAQEDLAMVLTSTGSLVEAEDLLVDLLEQLELTLPPGHPRILGAEASLSTLLMKTGNHERALSIQERLLENWPQMYPPTHEFMIAMKANLARTAREDGRPERARELLEELIRTCEANYPEDNSFRRRVYRDVARTLASSGAEDAEKELTSLMDRALVGERSWIRGLVALPPRLAWETASKGSEAISLWLTLSDVIEGRRAEHEKQLFSLVEEIRSFTGGGLHVSPAGEAGTEVEELHGRAFALRERVNAMAASLSSPDEKERSTAQEIAEVVLERDRTIAGLRRVLVQSGLAPPTIDASSLADQLPKDGAGVGFRSYTKTEHSGVQVDWMTAFVVGSSGSLTRVDLGPLAPIADATRRWRSAIGSTSGRGIGREDRGKTEDGTGHAAGSALRALVLEPVLEATGEVRILHVCVDDVLHLVPLDALPLDDGVVGDRLVVHNEVSFARILAKREWNPADPTLLAIGGVDFDAAVVAGWSADPIAAAPVNLSRGRLPDGFRALPGTLKEAEWLSETFERRFGVTPTLLMGAEATREAIREYAPSSRYIHLATHGYFADEFVVSWTDVSRTRPDWEQEQGDRIVRGMAPMTLCGLALAGANSRMDSVGRVPGILTAEELAGIDLSGCELAVLSACETNVGEKAPGQGIRSLQSALHAAGARTAVTSLWKVDDEWTRRLMEEFYERMWVKGEGKARALWNAKCALRAAGANVRDWSPWVLTGEPE